MRFLLKKLHSFIGESRNKELMSILPAIRTRRQARGEEKGGEMSSPQANALRIDFHSIFVEINRSNISGIFLCCSSHPPRPFFGLPLSFSSGNKIADQKKQTEHDFIRFHSTGLRGMKLRNKNCLPKEIAVCDVRERNFTLWRSRLFYHRDFSTLSLALIYLIIRLTQLDRISHLASPQMDTLYTTGHLHGYPTNINISSSTSSFYNPIGSTWGNQEGVVALGVVLGSSISLVGLAFAFITYR